MGAANSSCFLIVAPRKIINNLLQAIAKSELLTPRIRVFLHQLRGVKFTSPKTVFIGPDVIFDGSYPPAEISVGQNVYITRGVKLIAHQYNPDVLHHDFIRGAIEIKDNVFIGFNCVIICARIMDYSVIGAGTVITKDVPPYSVVVGTRQNIIKDRRNNTSC